MSELILDPLIVEDALGNPVIIGKEYGCVKQSNGFYTMQRGIVTRINENKAFLQYTGYATGLYGSLTPKDLPKGNFWCYSCILFPINQL